MKRVLSLSGVQVGLIVLFASFSCAEAARNLAVVARPSTSYVSGDCSVAALNDGSEHRNSRDRRAGSYGNWNHTGTQWVQYDWTQAISTDRVDVYWWDDRQGVRLPAAARLLYWNGSAFVPVKTESTLAVTGDQYNSLTFEEVTTPRLKLEIDSDGTYSTGILEWRVYDSGRSPAFPPDVTAGEDRTVVLGGKTYLSGKVKTLDVAGSEPTPMQWSKASGPGWVTFDDATRADTAAAFSAEGEHVLQLTAGKGNLTDTSHVTVQVVAAPPKEQLTLIDTKAYQLNSPLWDKRARAIIVNWIPHCITKINDPNLREGGINNFIDAANKLQAKPAGPHRGYVFSNAWIYNTIESICIALMVDAKGDSEIIEAHQFMRETLDDWIPKILAAQEPDGYLQTVYTLSDREHWAPKHRSDHEGYVAGYYLEAAVSHYMLTEGKDLRLYNSAKQLADCWENQIGPPPKQ
ncbi:MAG: Tat pathway signal protein, partial [Planctomycetes bacterium]|nr:Tat pathway signal protein [Planctomycetota bacterium]